LGDLNWLGREARYVEGRSIGIEWRFADRKSERLPSLVAELVKMKPQLIVAETTTAVRAAKEGTRTIPIVMTAVADAVGSGLVASLARPGANVTGMSFLGTELVGKRLELLKQAIPTVNRVAVLRHPGAHGDATVTRMRHETEVAARAMGLSTQLVDVPASGDLKGIFDPLSREKTSAVLVWPSPLFLAERKQLAALAIKNRLPVMYYLREYPEAGGLMSYGPSLPEMFRRSATFVDKILKGGNPADLRRRARSVSPSPSRCLCAPTRSFAARRTPRSATIRELLLSSELLFFSTVSCTAYRHAVHS
jgi:ABC-type uncharacterized transport system substrate-binding protein